VIQLKNKTALCGFLCRFLAPVYIQSGS
jgi:hypothetical protein